MIYGLLNSISFYNDDNIDYDNKNATKVNIVELCLYSSQKKKLIAYFSKTQRLRPNKKG